VSYTLNSLPPTVTLNVNTGLAYTPGQSILVDADAFDYFTATVDSYSNTGTTLTAYPTSYTGAGTYSSWFVNLDGAVGQQGPTGATGATGLTGVTGPTGPSNAGVVPIGGIIMWNGSTIPPNWNLCDGTNGTPNLTDQFILSSGTNAVNSTGGSSTITTDQMPSHTHTITSTDSGHGHSVYDPGHNHGIYDPSHNHSVTDPGHAHWSGLDYGWGDDIGGEGDDGSSNIQPLESNNDSINTNSQYTGITETNSAFTGIDISYNYTSITLYNGYASITSTAGSTGGGNPYMPPYYVLAFIMRIT
jgi:hypothetical protein